jgi:tetratricopeptide (TPR) repeat protein
MALAEVLAAQRRLEDAVGVGTVLDATTAQLSRVAKLAREARGPQARSVAELAAEWRQFVGWLHIATGRHQRAARYLKDAECAALEVDSPTIAAVARSFRGYQFAERGNLAAALRFNAMNAPVPGQHPSLIVFDTFRAARAYGTLGETDAARRLIEKATKHAARLSDPPPVVYWYTHAFFLIHSGMAAYAVHDYEAAAGTLTDGLADLPPDQRAAEWAVPYHTALADSRART